MTVAAPIDRVVDYLGNAYVGSILVNPTTGGDHIRLLIACGALGTTIWVSSHQRNEKRCRISSW
jgi:hypothetical protein